MTAHPAARALVAVLAALVLPAACSSGADDGDGDGATATTAAPGDGAPAATDQGTTTELELGPGQVGHPVGTSFQHQSFVITVGHAVYDPEAERLSLGLRFWNVSGRWAQTDTTSQLELPDGTTVPFSGELVPVPPGVATEVTAVAAPVPVDPLEDGVVSWGSAAYEQPTFRLDGDGGEHLWLPADVAMDGWTQIGKFGLHLTGVQVHASQVDLGIHATPGTRVLRALLEEYTARGTTSPFTAASNVLLRLPSGEVVDAVHGSAAASALSWTAQGGQWADFVVPADVAGRYELLLASIPKVGFGTLQPDLIERRSIPFELDEVVAGPAPDAPLAVPMANPSPAEGEGDPFDITLEVGSMNIPGYDLRPTRLSYDPTTRQASLDATVTSLRSSVRPSGGLLSADPTFGFRVVLDAGGHLVEGLLAGDPTLDHDTPTDLTFEFNGLRRLRPEDAGLHIGPGEGAVASLPLGEGSEVVAWPPAPVAQVVDAAPAVAGDWTVQLRAYRIGLLDPDIRPSPGRRQLEVSLDVTAASTARPNALGLSFVPLTQVLLAGGTGYDQGPISDSGTVEVVPDQTVRLTVTFDVPDTFRGGRTPFVVRSRSELDLLTHWVETRFLADLTDVGSEEDFG